MSSGNGTSDLTFMMIRATNVSADTIRQIAEVIAPQLAGDGDPRAVRLPAADTRPALPPAEALDDPPVDPGEETAPPAIEEDPIRRRRRPRKLLGRPVGGRTRLVLSCDQHPGKTFTTKEAAKLAGVKPVTVCAAVSSGRTAGGLMFRREAATAPAPRRQEESGDEPDAAPENASEKPSDEEVEPTPGRCWNRFEPKAARTAARQKIGRPKNVSDFNKQHAGITLHYDLGQDTTRGAAAGDVMPTNGQRSSAWDPPAPPDLQRKL